MERKREMETRKERTGTNCDSRRCRGARAAVTEIEHRKSSEEIVSCNFPKNGLGKLP